MSSAVTPDNCRDAQEAVERTQEAEARVFESFKARKGTAYAEAMRDGRERERQDRIKRNDREIERMDAQGQGNGSKLVTLKNGKKLLVFHE